MAKGTQYSQQFKGDENFKFVTRIKYKENVK